MARRYFNTVEAAERHLEVRRKAAYKQIGKKGWKILHDGSCIIKQPIWSKPTKLDNCDLYASTQTNVSKWFVFLLITTDEMVKDLKNFKSIDVQAEETILLKEMEMKLKWK